jgi:mRNA interferase MazF
VVTRGEVWWYEHPEHARRPFAILTRDVAIPVLEQILAVPATRTVRGIPTEVELDESDGMPTRCVLVLDNVTVIRKSLCTERIARLDDERMLAVCEALRIATAC